MLPLSVLDLSVVTTATKPAAALRNSIDLARHVDGLGYVRYWLAEHHNLASVASPAPAVRSALIRSSGATATAYLQAATAAGGKSEISPEEFGALLEKALAGILQRGKAAVGEKTMVDALQPAVETYQTALKSGKPFAEALLAASNAAEKGMESTVPLLAKKGRASYLGERSIGHQDPGATSVNLLFRAARETLA